MSSSDFKARPNTSSFMFKNTEIFQTRDGQNSVNFRTLTWPIVAVLFLKIQFSTGVLSIPTAMHTLGAVGGSLSIISWCAWTQYTAIIMGDFRAKHGGCHSIADLAEVVGGRILKEAIGLLFIFANVLCAGSAIIATSTALNALSLHAACTVWWALIAATLIAFCASIRKLENLTFLTWAGFASVFSAVLIVVIAVTIPDRPAAAPQRGPFELGFHAFPVPAPSFAEGMVASCTIFVSSSNTGAFIPVISEMKSPKDYNKAVYTSMTTLTVLYFVFGLVVYRYCGQWVASPSLGSAGQTIKMISYGVGLLGLIVTGCLYTHIGAKYAFVRILRNSRHLQDNTIIHWTTWLGCTFSIVAVGFVLAEAIPIFNYLLALLGAIVFGPVAIIFPAYLWLYDHGHYRCNSLRKKVIYAFHAFFIPFGLFITVAGTYAVCLQIKDAYATGQISSVFSCADNSNST
ncbi:uncharacterized protein BO88DRAFT_426656 [Aspergillus vadensis CBS 113365]|uniref:Amino acid transporter transmembrane domain-containing protein n=1 Tax=Aspergillus vadensis (strain CBS 113365 / IMI 142717 / IBT 24658) TaxID=1448311 RepID=A0A319BQI8_ASPVC|nr:hypothetical protein BO88DRAFT_426656 [Aspergillus vadensis CBS 113365]PYH68003.1 hypothetical protein BO88DRAFT_426656 [Aspergillus vadensis CBS 113365]